MTLPPMPIVSKDNSESAGKKRPAKSTGKRTSKRRGELAELAFVWKAASLGFTVAKPYGDSDRYDFIVDSGGRLIRVQVKSASRLSQGTYFITTQRCSNGTSIPYTSDEIDFLVGYIFPEDAWVVVPVEALAGRKSIHVFPHDRAGEGIYAAYREAWCQLACPREHLIPATPSLRTSTSNPVAALDATRNARCTLDRDWVALTAGRDLDWRAKLKWWLRVHS